MINFVSFFTISVRCGVITGILTDSNHELFLAKLQNGRMIFKKPLNITNV
jgi:hypothetical protein